MKYKPRLLIYAPSDIVLSGLEKVLMSKGEFWVCGKSKNPNSIVGSIQEHEAQVLVADFSLGRINVNFHSLIRVRNKLPKFPILIISPLDEKRYAPCCFYYGATGYVQMNRPYKEMEKAILDVIKGEIYASSPFFLQEADKLRKIGFVDPMAVLTPREQEAYRLLGLGCHTKETARRLHICEKTADAHIRHAMKKLGYNSREELSRDATLKVYFDYTPLPSKKKTKK